MLCLTIGVKHFIINQFNGLLCDFNCIYLTIARRAARRPYSHAARRAARRAASRPDRRGRGPSRGPLHVLRSDREIRCDPVHYFAQCKEKDRTFKVFIRKVSAIPTDLAQH